MIDWQFLDQHIRSLLFQQKLKTELTEKSAILGSVREVRLQGKQFGSRRSFQSACYVSHTCLSFQNNTDKILHPQPQVLKSRLHLSSLDLCHGNIEQSLTGTKILRQLVVYNHVIFGVKQTLVSFLILEMCDLAHITLAL